MSKIERERAKGDKKEIQGERVKERKEIKKRFKGRERERERR